MEPILHIPKINLEILSEKELVIYGNLDNQPYGRSLALDVTKKLSIPEYEGWGLFHSHRDYCGLGLFFFEGFYSLGVVFDGYSPYPLLVTCKKEVDFIAWLSNENDQSMTLYGKKFNNQTITRLRLEWFLEDNYSPVWNDYCRYLRDRNTPYF